LFFGILHTFPTGYSTKDPSQLGSVSHGSESESDLFPTDDFHGLPIKTRTRGQAWILQRWTDTWNSTTPVNGETYHESPETRDCVTCVTCVTNYLTSHNMASSSHSGRDNDPGRDQHQPKPPWASNKGKGRGKPPDLPNQEGDQEDQPCPTKGGYKSKHAQKRVCEEGSDSWDSEDSIYQDMAGIARPHADVVRHAYDIPNMFGSDTEETHLGTEDSEAGVPPSTFGEGPESPLPRAAEPQASTSCTARPRRPPPSLARDDTSSSVSSRSSK